MQIKVAVFFQATQPPVVGLTKKPLKEGSYKDSGADIAFALASVGISIVTPVANPAPAQDLDWVFPDTDAGIQRAVAAGANVLWMNTVLFAEHPVKNWFGKGLEFIGQDPRVADAIDNKFATNQMLQERDLPIAQAQLFSGMIQNFTYPLVIKPIRGRGSQGVSVVHNDKELMARYQELVDADIYGTEFVIEEFLEGTEITITVMPPGEFTIANRIVTNTQCWALPAVVRFNHHNNIAPYSGIVAIAQNSRALTSSEMQDSAIQKILQECESAANLVRARSPIRIDCRQNANGLYKMFDLNAKPNVTGAGRPGRQDQDSLVVLAANAMGWSYKDLLLAILGTRWQNEH